MRTRYWARAVGSFAMFSLLTAATLAAHAPAASPEPAADGGEDLGHAHALVLVSGDDEDRDEDVRVEVEVDEDENEGPSPREKKKVRVYRKVVRDSGSFFGIGVADIDEDRAKELDLDEEHGVEVKMVYPGSAAVRAGVKVEDVILEFNGDRVDGTEDFVSKVRETPVDGRVKILVVRDGREVTLTGRMGKRTAPRIYRFKHKSGDGGEDRWGWIDTPEAPEPPEPGEIPTPPEPGEPPEPPEAGLFEMEIPEIPEIHIPDIPTPLLSWQAPRLGVETEAIGSQLADYFGVKEGVLVRSVLKGSVAEKAGIKAGDVITKIGDRDVQRPGDIASALRSQEAGESFSITLVRNRREMTLNGKLEERKTKLKERRRSRSSRSDSESRSDSRSNADSESDSDSNSL